MSSFSFREWYALNAKRLNERRKQKYHSDPDHRQKVLDTNQESRRRRKNATKGSKKKSLRARTGGQRYKIVPGVVEGRTEPLVTIGALAETLQCSIQVIRVWERQGLIPKTPLRSGKRSRGDRLYTRGQVEEIRTILKAQGKLSSAGVVEDRPTRTESRELKRWIRRKNGKVVQVPLLLIGELARAVGRNVATLEQLEARGFLPETPFRTSSVGRRLYTEKMILAVQAAFKKRGGEIRGDEAWQSFRDEILAKWTAQHVMGAVLLEAAPRKKQVTANVATKKVPRPASASASLPN